MRKKIIYITAVIIVILVGIVIYFSAQKINQLTTQSNQSGSLPNIGLSGTNNNGANQNSATTSASSSINKNLNIVSDEQVLNYFIEKDSSVIVINNSGNIISISGNNKNTISSLGIQNIIKTSFSYDGSKLLVNFGDIKDPQTSIFDINNKSWIPLSAGIISPVWAPDSYKIAYLTNNKDYTETLNIIDISKTKPTTSKIITLHILDFSLNWILKNDILLSDKASAYTLSSVWSLNLTNKTLSSIITKNRGLELLWSNNIINTLVGLEFVANESLVGGQLNLIDSTGNKTTNLNFITLPSKCAFNKYSENNSIISASTTMSSTQTKQTTSTINNSYLALYCAVPRDQNVLSANALPDLYDQKGLFTSDNIYRINILNGNIDTLFNDQDQNIDVSKIKIFNNNLYFINRLDQKLYSLSL
jgi:hypothetical protein